MTTWKYITSCAIISIAIGLLIAISFDKRAPFKFIYIYTAVISSVAIVYMTFGPFPISDVMKSNDGQGGFANLFIHIWIYLSLYLSYLLFFLFRFLMIQYGKWKVSKSLEIISAIVLQFIVAASSFYFLSKGNTF